MKEGSLTLDELGPYTKNPLIVKVLNYPKMITDLEHKANQLEELIYELGRKIGENSDTNAIADGIADFKANLSSSPKIAWVLKEPYDDIKESKPSGGGWSIPKDCFMKEGNWGVLTR